MPSPIPLFYRLFFLYLDPLICFSGVYLCLFDQKTYILNGVPSFLHPTPLTITSLDAYLMHALGAWSIAILSMQILLLHNYKNDVKLWKILQFSVLLIDLVLVWVVAVAWNGADGNGKGWVWERWEQGDWVNNGILAMVITMRGAFLGGVGFGLRR